MTAALAAGLSEQMIRDGLVGVALPLLTGLSLSLLAWWLGSRAKAKGDGPSKLDQRAIMGPALGVGLGYLIALVGIQGTPPSGWSLSAGHWQFYVLIAAIVLAGIDGFLTCRRYGPAVRWVGRAAIAGFVVWAQLRSAREHQWAAGAERIVWSAGVGVWMLLAMGVLDGVLTRTRAAGTAVVLALLAAGAVPAIFDAGATAQWQITGGLAAALVGAAVAGVLFKDRRLGPPIATVFVVWLSGTLISAHLYSEMPTWHAAVLAASPIALLIADIPPIAGLSATKRWIARLVIVLAISAAVSALATPGFIEQLTGSGSGSADDYWDG